ncbi:inositol polyphosphate-5-phosphatase f, putative [Ichthyophthirius multifiliis]|uniref:Inositol polyphosphate-5-phosphatase f, putative n=1 Tax=Ichthyophthirius multifiliis TaxID=5932 RepID=G0R4I8_ICHMU|nr:inositol polyphosphate-5-phosphatase f, putative [Ichthyophthirius multifiliis]EGR27616.1 inositol polyphosphate-5-phosphatase f, putative [Ichthyophthirius multifiliis]|eukprot:XP_004025068.1 inositol polyphosphate-5-phosphatase f, putative [Ichthyophthirius multifiliis]
MKKHSDGEQLLTDIYEKHILHNNLPFVKYKFFDFHEHCKHQKYENVNPLIQELSKMNKNLLFFAENTITGNILVQQQGIVRTNCLDCLDRTNVLQTKIALDILDFQLNYLGVNLQGIFFIQKKQKKKKLNKIIQKINLEKNP